MQSTTNLTAGAVALALICVTVLASLGRVDGPTALTTLQWVLVTFIGGTSLHGAAAHFASMKKAAPADPPAVDPRIEKLQAELDGLKIGSGK